MEQKKMHETHRINSATLLAYAILTFVLLFAYLLEFIKGSRTLTYTIIFSVLDLLPYVSAMIMYKKNKASNKVMYILCIGFSILYTYVLLTAAVPTTFVYMFLIYILLIPYGNLMLCYISGGFAVVANIISVVIGFMNGSLTSSDLAMVEIQVLSIALCAFFSGLATSVIRKVNNQKMSEINDEKDKTESVLSNTLVLSKGISEDIEAVTERMEHLKQSVATTRDSMQDVSAGTNDTAESMQLQLMQTEEITVQVDKAKEVSSVIAEDVRQTEESIEIGKVNIDNLLSFVNQSEVASEMVASKMKELTENTNQMNVIVDMINSVTQQTSLLSLNASIEAARAGEAGKGFAVVASEISTLAQQTSEATVNITGLINAISVSIKDVFKAINQLMESNREQNASANTMAANFEKIEACSNNISKVSTDLELVISQLATLNENIVENINNVSAVTEEVSARASETLSGSENDALVVEEITEVIVNINDKAKQLN